MTDIVSKESHPGRMMTSRVVFSYIMISVNGIKLHQITRNYTMHACMAACVWACMAACMYVCVSSILILSGWFSMKQLLCLH